MSRAGEERPQDRPLVLLASHGRVRGSLPWRNAAPAPLAVRQARIHCPPLRGRHGERLHEARLSGRLSPNAEGRLGVKFRIDERTMPGVYDGELEVEGKTIPMVVAVAEERSLSITPDRLTIESDRPGGDDHVVVAENRGNVSVTVEQPGGIRMEPVNRVCIVAREILTRADTASAASLQDALLQAAAASVRTDPILGVRIVGAPYQLHPGQTMALTVRVRVPKLVEPEYSAAVEIAGVPLSIRVLRAGHGDAPDAPPRDRPTR